MTDFVGKIENCKVIMKISKRDGGPPARDSIMIADQRKEMILS